MSETVHYKGMMKLISKLEGETLEGQLRRLIGDVGYEDFDDLLEHVRYDMDDEYFINGEDVYAVTKEYVDPYKDLFNGTVKDDGAISFEVRYYNGGCSFSESLEEVLNSIENKK